MDGPALQALWREVDEQHASLAPDYFRAAASGPTRTRADMLRSFGSANEVVLVAEIGGAVRGFLRAQIYDTPPEPVMVPRRRAHVDAVVVAAGWRRRGVGAALIHAVDAWAREHDAEELVLTLWDGNRAADAFYGGLGFAPVSHVLRRKL